MNSEPCTVWLTHQQEYVTFKSLSAFRVYLNTACPTWVEDHESKEAKERIARDRIVLIMEDNRQVFAERLLPGQTLN